eukprot:TRINITY_DN18491_c0_g1_i1.p4 TRINITY_DN18491_c0_g1~~TRINITY_DN18491_c0_g1_i1.p4  ORF type:complete len:151 (-),score=1.37 TRINITY_DN18491_c0_g1_i1:242-694(-)
MALCVRAASSESVVVSEESSAAWRAAGPQPPEQGLAHGDQPPRAWHHRPQNKDSLTVTSRREEGELRRGGRWRGQDLGRRGEGGGDAGAAAALHLLQLGAVPEVPRGAMRGRVRMGARGACGVAGRYAVERRVGVPEEIPPRSRSPRPAP